MKKVAVLLAAYNCEKYLDEQMESILSQIEVGVDVYISLDESSDRSYDLIYEYKKKYKNIYFLSYGKKYGSAGKNFLRLIYDVDICNYDYVSFSDQDDIWHTSKLSRAIKMLIKNKADAYSSNVHAFWENGKVKLINKSSPQTEFDYLFQSAGPGCTYVFTKDSFQSLKKYLIINKDRISLVWMHDWLCYSFYRNNRFKWIFDNKSLMQYRQHQNNELGVNLGFISVINRAKILFSKRGENLILNQAKFLRQEELRPIKYINEGRLGYLKLALISFKLRRKITEKFFCLLYFFIKFIRGY